MNKLFKYPKKILIKTGVYTLHHKSKPNVYYVGSTSKITGKYPSDKGFYHRWTRHLYLLKQGKHDSKYLQNVVNKYGIDNLEFEILDFYDPEFCLGAEQYWINMLNSSNRIYGYNTNFIPNSRLGTKHSLKSKLRMKENKKKLLEKYYNIVIQLYNKDMYCKNIAKQVNINTRTVSKILKLNNILIKSRSSYYRKPILQYNLDNNLIKEWKSACEIEENLGFKNSHINQVCKSKRKIAYKFKWRFKNE